MPGAHTRRLRRSEVFSYLQSTILTAPRKARRGTRRMPERPVTHPLHPTRRTRQRRVTQLRIHPVRIERCQHPSARTRDFRMRIRRRIHPLKHTLPSIRLKNKDITHIRKGRPITHNPKKTDLAFAAVFILQKSTHHKRSFHSPQQHISPNPFAPIRGTQKAIHHFKINISMCIRSTNTKRVHVTTAYLEQRNRTNPLNNTHPILFLCSDA